MRKPAHILLLFFLVSAASAQPIRNDDKRSFTDMTPIQLDVDGDEVLDTIQPRTFSARPTGTRRRATRRPGTIQRWIAFDLNITNGRKMKSFFRHWYGTDIAEYWVYELVMGGDLNHDGKPDLIFYMGDDTTHETVVLLNKGSAFVARSAGVISVEYSVEANLEIVALAPYDVETGSIQKSRRIAQWSAKREVFEGTEMVWVRSPRAVIRSAPRANGPVLLRAQTGDAFRVLIASSSTSGSKVWLHVDAGVGMGWILRSDVDYHSPLAVP
jgi:hypothetical protein